MATSYPPLPDVPVPLCTPPPYLKRSLSFFPLQSSFSGYTPPLQWHVSQASSTPSSRRHAAPHRLLQKCSLHAPVSPKRTERVSLAFPVPYLAPCLAQGGCPKRLLTWTVRRPAGLSCSRGGHTGMPKEQTPGATSLFQPMPGSFNCPPGRSPTPYLAPPSLAWRPLSAQPALPFQGVSAGD